MNNIGVLEIVGPNKDVARKICAVAFNLVIFLDAFKTVINYFGRVLSLNPLLLLCP